MIGVRSVRSKAANKWSVMLSKNVPAFSKSLRTPPNPLFMGLYDMMGNMMMNPQCKSAINKKERCYSTWVGHAATHLDGAVRYR